jgi:hypothetical protein
MNSRGTSRLRFAIILALSLIVWSDAAFASFLCPHSSGCQHEMAGMTEPGAQDAAPEQTSSAPPAMPCCPVEADTTVGCDTSAMNCCAWHHPDKDSSAVLFASDQPRPKQLVALLPAAAPAVAAVAPHGPVPFSAIDLGYTKPVSQKKADLRI